MAARSVLALALLIASVLPGASVAGAAEGDDAVLRVGTSQDLDSMNPYQTALVVGFEVFTLNYQLLTAWDKDLKPMPSYAASWSANDDGTEYTFKIDPDKKWSDGEPATAEDAAFSLQLALDGAASEAGALCLGYLDPYLTNAAVSEVSAPDPQTLVVKLERPNDRILSSYLPIIPKHVWEGKTSDTICDDNFDPPIIGTGPYQAQAWETGQNVRFERNPNWDGGDLAASEVVIQFFKSEDTMAQALQRDELDYAQNVLSDQFDQLTGQPNITTVAGTSNGFTELGFNTYGTGTGKTIDGGGPSTKALLDPAFRDALGYAIDKQALVDRVLGGYGEVGTTQVPPFQTNWHKEPATVRTFDIEQAKSKLDAAGYRLDGSTRLDKEGKPIVLDLVFPDSDTTYATTAQFITEWFGQLGIKVNGAQFDSDTLVDKMLPPEADGTADYDLFIWGWGGDVDPNSLLEIFNCDQIGGSSDSLYCNTAYDDLFTKQNEATTPEERKQYMDQMQDIMYTEAPYHILYYDAALHAYRTDHFTGWQNQPENGTPLFGYGSFGYTVLQLAGAAGPGASAGPSGQPAPSGTAASPAPSAGPTTPSAGEGGNTGLIVGALAVVAVVAVGGFVLMRRRGPATEEE
jgi:peptide/nickel transport system substrate-binding protein